MPAGRLDHLVPEVKVKSKEDATPDANLVEEGREVISSNDPPLTHNYDALVEARLDLRQQLTIRLRPEDHEFLRALSYRSRKPMNFWLEMAIIEFRRSRGG